MAQPNLSSITQSANPFTGGSQYTALTGKKPKIPLASIIHAQIPGYRIAKEAQLEREVSEEAHKEQMKLEEEKLEIAEAEGKKAAKIGAVQTGIMGAYVGKKAGLFGGKEVAGVAAGETAAAGAGEVAGVGGVAEVGTTGEVVAGQAEAVGGPISLPGTGGALAIELVREPIEEGVESKYGETTGGVAHVAIRAGQGYLIGGPIGGAIGAGVGIVEEAADTMLCTELHRQGLLPDHIYQADCEYAKTIPTNIVIGYRVWAKHLVPVMERSKLFTRLIGIFIRAWAYHMAFKAGAVPESNRLGAFIERVGVPICEKIGEAMFNRKIEHYCSHLII